MIIEAIWWAEVILQQNEFPIEQTIIRKMDTFAISHLHSQARWVGSRPMREHVTNVTSS